VELWRLRSGIYIVYYIYSQPLFGIDKMIRQVILFRNGHAFDGSWVAYCTLFAGLPYPELYLLS